MAFSFFTSHFSSWFFLSSCRIFISLSFSLSLPVPFSFHSRSSSSLTLPHSQWHQYCYTPTSSTTATLSFELFDYGRIGKQKVGCLVISAGSLCSTASGLPYPDIPEWSTSSSCHWLLPFNLLPFESSCRSRSSLSCCISHWIHQSKRIICRRILLLMFLGHCWVGSCVQSPCPGLK